MAKEMEGQRTGSIYLHLQKTIQRKGCIEVALTDKTSERRVWYSAGGGIAKMGPHPTERRAWESLGFNQTEALKKIGLGPDGDRGEAGFSPIEREWARPTAEPNGIIGGYTGQGAKTVIPSHASVKISFRLVADQNPVAIRDAFFAWLEARTPAGCRWELIDHSGGPPATVPTESAHLSAARRALKNASGIEPALIRSGGSIPVAGLLKSELDLDTVFMGFGLDDDRVHSPNEKFELDCFRLGMRRPDPERRRHGTLPSHGRTAHTRLGQPGGIRRLARMDRRRAGDSRAGTADPGRPLIPNPARPYRRPTKSRTADRRGG